MERLKTNSPVTWYLLEWYKQNKRELPWRGIADPYLTWVSEIILQQTRVKQGWDYYTRFTRCFPNVQALANASEEEVLKVWQGLGYYSRARNMHAAAKEITSRFNGKFPTRHADILSLKGVGEYTAAAISSIAFNEPYAAVDGNVLRVIARLFAIEESIQSSKGKKTIAEIARSLLPETDPGTFNQAIMDFGSLVCTPSQPKCDDCPLRDFCMARSLNRVTDFPVTSKKKKSRKRYFHYFYILHAGFTYITRRTGQDIWKNLYEFPLVETPGPVQLVGLQEYDTYQDIFATLPSLPIDPPLSFKHVLSHQEIHARFYRVILPGETVFTPPGHLLRIQQEQLDHYPVSRLIRKYLESNHDSYGELQKNA